mmetsp:Transcript_16296/g.48307  ORF Transcript_16296/g.48307 Transcript_16296/m.48307 type:complete len:670 (+) Transcript_16296:166-2175(+)
MDFQVTRARMLTCGWTGTCRRELSRQAVRDEWALSRMVTIITMRLRADTAGNVQRLPSGKRLVAVALLLLLLEDAKDEIALGDVGGEEGGVVWRHAEHAPVVRDGGHNLHTHRLLRVFRDVFGRVKVKADGWHQARRFECRRDVVLLRLQDLVKARYQPHVLGHCLNSVLRGHQHGALVLALAVPLLLGEEGLLLLEQGRVRGRAVVPSRKSAARVSGAEYLGRGRDADHRQIVALHLLPGRVNPVLWVVIHHGRVVIAQCGGGKGPVVVKEGRRRRVVHPNLHRGVRRVRADPRAEVTPRRLQGHASELHRDRRRPILTVDGRVELLVVVAADAAHRAESRKGQVAPRRVAGDEDVLRPVALADDLIPFPRVAGLLENIPGDGEGRVVVLGVVDIGIESLAAPPLRLGRPLVIGREDDAAGGLHQLRSDDRLVDTAEQYVGAAVVVDDELVRVRLRGAVLGRQVGLVPRAKPLSGKRRQVVRPTPGIGTAGALWPRPETVVGDGLVAPSVTATATPTPHDLRHGVLAGVAVGHAVPSRAGGGRKARVATEAAGPVGVDEFVAKQAHRAARFRRVEHRLGYVRVVLAAEQGGREKTVDGVHQGAVDIGVVEFLVEDAADRVALRVLLARLAGHKLAEALPEDAPHRQNREAADDARAGADAVRQLAARG